MAESTLNFRARLQAAARGREVGWALGLLAVAALALAMQLHATRFGPGLRGDSVWYIAGARQLIRGLGYARLTGDGSPVPITAFPPLYSMLLAALGWVSRQDPLVVSRYLNSVLYPANTLLLAWLIRRLAGSALLALLGALVFVSGWPFFYLHMLAMTEGLFYLLVMLSLVSLERATAREGVGWPLLAGTLAVAATLTRYAGVALLPVGVLSLLLLRRTSLGQRLVALASFSIAFGLPLGAWLMRNARLGGSATGRGLRFHLTRADIVLNLDTAARWVLPFEMVRQTRILLFLGLSGVVGLAVLYLIYSAWRRYGLGDERVRWLLILNLFVGAYLAVFWGSSAFLDSTMGLTTRYMSPLFIVGILMVPLLVKSSPVSARLTKFGTGCCALAGALLVALTLPASIERARDPALYLGYTAIRVLGLEEAMTALAQLPPSTEIITDDVEGVYMLTGRPAYMVPIWYDTYKEEARQDFPLQMERTRQRLREGAVLFLSPTFDTKQSFLPDRATLTEGLKQVFDGVGGDIYVDPEAWAGKPLPWGGVVPDE